MKTFDGKLVGFLHEFDEKGIQCKPLLDRQHEFYLEMKDQATADSLFITTLHHVTMLRGYKMPDHCVMVQK
jgi:hypothetical protein